FFISSRRRHTSSKRDWSSDVCSSDLDSWLAYCEQECARLGVDFAAVALHLPGTANVEGRARRERRLALLQLTSPQGCLVLAQHQNDQAETLLLHLLRGAGPQGLSDRQRCSAYQG